MDVLELLKHYQNDEISELDKQFFTYFAYSYGIENDSQNHPYFIIRLFSKITRIDVLIILIHPFLTDPCLLWSSNVVFH